MRPASDLYDMLYSYSDALMLVVFWFWKYFEMQLISKNFAVLVLNKVRVSGRAGHLQVSVGS